MQCQLFFHEGLVSENNIKSYKTSSLVNITTRRSIFKKIFPNIIPLLPISPFQPPMKLHKKEQTTQPLTSQTNNKYTSTTDISGKFLAASCPRRRQKRWSNANWFSLPACKPGQKPHYAFVPCDSRALILASRGTWLDAPEEENNKKMGKDGPLEIVAGAAFFFGESF